LSSEVAVVCSVHLTHPTFTDKGVDAVWAQPYADDGGRRHHCGGAGPHHGWRRGMGEKRLNPTPELDVPIASPFAIGRLRAPSQRGCYVEQVGNALPTRTHDASERWARARASQAFASFQSRVTVSAETPRTSAVSSMVKPPNSRSSTTLPRRASWAARA